MTRAELVEKMARGMSKSGEGAHEKFWPGYTDQATAALAAPPNKLLTLQFPASSLNTV